MSSPMGIRVRMKLPQQARHQTEPVCNDRFQGSSAGSANEDAGGAGSPSQIAAVPFLSGQFVC